MFTRVYEFPHTEQIMHELNEDDCIIKSSAPPLLIKYGANALMCNHEPLHFMQHEKYAHLSSFHRVQFPELLKQKYKLSLSMAEIALWEIFTLFQLWSHKMIDLTEMNLKNILSIHKSKTNHQICIVFQYTLQEWDSITAWQYILQHWSEIVHAHKIGSTLILQCFGFQTRIAVECLTLLTQRFEHVYIVYPSTNSALSNECYIVCLQATQSLKNMQMPLSQYLWSFGNVHVPRTVSSLIQCINAKHIPEKYNAYTTIKMATQNETSSSVDQNAHHEQWIKSFIDNDANASTLLESALQRSQMACKNFT